MTLLTRENTDLLLKPPAGVLELYAIQARLLTKAEARSTLVAKEKIKYSRISSTVCSLLLH
jgi:hypothetical protein